MGAFPEIGHLDFGLAGNLAATFCGVERPHPYAERFAYVPNPSPGERLHNRGVKSILEKHPWYESRWKPQLEKESFIESNQMLFMLVPRWANDIAHVIGRCIVRRGTTSMNR